MNEPKFTPGPWFSTENAAQVVVVGAEKKAIAVCGKALLGGGEKAVANGRLIAAAPDLYEALEYAIRYLAELDWYDLRSAKEMVLQYLQKNLAKARGE